MALTVKVIDANLTRDTDTVSKMDPYCIVTVGSETHKTSVKSGAGTNPVWNEVLQFGQKGDTLKIVVKDDDVFKDDEVGSGSFNIAPAYNNPGKPATIPIEVYYKNTSAGKVLVTVEYQGGKW